MDVRCGQQRRRRGGGRRLMGVVAIDGRRLQMAAAAIGRQWWRRQCGRGRGRTTAVADDSGGGLFMRDVIRGRSTYGCHFHKFPCMRTQALLALCTLAGIQIPGNNNCGQRGKRMKNTVCNDASSSNLKGKPMTKTIWLHWLHGLQNTFPPQTKRAYIKHNCA